MRYCHAVIRSPSTEISIENLTTEEAAAQIVRLINESPRSPRPDEIEAVIARVTQTTEPQSVRVEWSREPLARLPALSEEHQAYRRIVAEIAKFDEEGWPPGVDGKEDEAATEVYEAAIGAVCDTAIALERQIWATPAKTLADVLLRGEIALYNENRIMEAHDDDDGYHDERSVAQLIRAVVSVLGGLYGR